MNTEAQLSGKQRTFEVNLAPRKGLPNAWNVEAIDADGSIEQAIFIGPRAEERARAYRSSMYAQDTTSK